MERIKKWVDGTVESNSKKVMAGDHAVQNHTAIAIAMEAANMGASAASLAIGQNKRVELGCHVAGQIAASEYPIRTDTVKVCMEALRLVDTMFDLVARNPASMMEEAKHMAEAMAEPGREPS